MQGSQVHVFPTSGDPLMSSATSAWNNLRATIFSAENVVLLPMIAEITTHPMFQWVRVPQLYTTLYTAGLQGKTQAQVFVCKKLTLERIKRMLDGMKSGA
jgi:hypothetical protein